MTTLTSFGRVALLAICVTAAACEKSDGGGGADPLDAVTDERVAGAGERVAALESATSTLDEALLDAPLPLPAEVWIDGAPVAVPAQTTPPTVRILQEDLLVLLAGLEAAEIEGATDAELQPFIAEGRALEILFRGAATELAANGAPPPNEKLRSSQVVFGLASTGALVGTLCFALENQAFFEGAPQQATAVAAMHEKTNDVVAAEQAIPGVIEDTVNASAIIGGDLSDQATLAASASAQATSDGLTAVAAEIDAYAATLDSQAYFDRSTALEGGELTYLNLTLPQATDAQIAELYAKLAIMDPNSSPTVHLELQALATQLRLAYLDSQYTSSTSSLLGLDGFLADVAVHLTEIPAVSAAMGPAMTELETALGSATPGATLAALLADLTTAHAAVIVEMTEFDATMVQENASVAALGETLKQSLDEAVEAADDL